MKRFGLYAIMAISSFLLCCSAGQGADASLLQVESSCGWTERLETCLGSTFYLVVLPGDEGQATLHHIYPNGSIQNTATSSWATIVFPYMQMNREGMSSSTSSLARRATR